MSTICDLLARQQERGGAPALTWYGEGVERIELSGAVLVNWVTKTVNLLHAECDADTNTQVLLDLPAHWRTLVWALASWRCGCEVVMPPGNCGTGADKTLPSSTPTVDIVVTSRPECFGQAPELIAVTLGALARSFAGQLPAGAIDAASAVMTYGDTLDYVPNNGSEMTIAGKSVVRAAAPGRILVAAHDNAAFILHTAAILAGGGSVVAFAPGRQLDLGAQGVARICATEQVDR